MSSILKALKKVEEQKNARPQFDLDLATGIMRERRTERTRPWLIPTGMAVAAIAAALTTYGIMEYKEGRPAAEQHQVGRPAVSVTEQPAPAPPAPPSPAVSISQPAAVTASPEKTNAASRQAVPTPPIAPQITVRQPAPAAATSAKTQAAKSDSSPESSAPPHAAAAERKKEAPTAATVLPNLKLTGIAWQKDSSNRFAVVNGSAVSQGAVVDGARIEEIMPDKVRFSAGQRTFEIPLGKIQN